MKLNLTNEEAIERLDGISKLIGYDKDSVLVCQTQTAIQMAIDALKAQPMHGYKIDFFTPTAQAWLSTFNTDSATECFTAVQELKKKLEGDANVDNN